MITLNQKQVVSLYSEAIKMGLGETIEFKFVSQSVLSGNVHIEITRPGVLGRRVCLEKTGGATAEGEFLPETALEQPLSIVEEDEDGLVAQSNAAHLEEGSSNAL